MNKLLFGSGIALLALGFSAKLAYNKLFPPSDPISKQVIVNKLIDMRQLLFPILFEIADIVQKRLIPKGVPPDQAKIFIMQNQALAFKTNIQTILKEKIYFDVDQADFKQAIQQTYKNDKEVQFYKKAFQDQYEKCFLGIKPQNLSTKMLLINKDQLLLIVKALLEGKLDRLKKIVQEHQKQLDLTNSKLMTLQAKQQSLAIKLNALLAKDEKQDDELRTKLLKDHNITDPKVFQFAIAKFLQQSPIFKEKYLFLQTYFKENLQEILSSLQ